MNLSGGRDVKQISVGPLLIPSLTYCQLVCGNKLIRNGILAICTMEAQSEITTTPQEHNFR